jgi:alcohol dehydrogenase class IV
MEREAMGGAEFVFAGELAAARELIAGHGLAAPAEIAGGDGMAAQAGEMALRLAHPGPCVLVTGGDSRRAAGVRAALGEAGFRVAAVVPVEGEPTVDAVDAASARVRDAAPVLLVAVGGGSAMDTAKALAALATNPGSVQDYLEGVGRGLTVDRDPLPLLAIPTTAGTGAEMTKNAVIADYRQGFKKSMRDSRLIPRAAMLDPRLTATMPRAVTAAGGMDAITQLIESCISTKRSAGSTALAHHCLRWVHDALPACCEHPDNMHARGAMLLASAMSGVCLANAGLALAHGIASGLGGLHPVPHGRICGILLPHTLRYNHEACAEEIQLALAAFLNESKPRANTIDRGIAALEELVRRTGLPLNFKELGLSDAQVHAVAEHSLGSSLSGNPIPMTAADVYAFLKPLC